METKKLLKSLKRRLSGMLCLVVLLCTAQGVYAKSFSNGYTLYVDASSCSWYRDGGCEASIYLWGTNTIGPLHMEIVDADKKLYKYVFTSSSDCSNFKVFRQPSSSTGWNDQYDGFEGDFNSMETKNTIKVNSGSSGFSWSTYTPVTYTYYLVGFNDWDHPIEMPVSNGIATCTKALEGGTTYDGGKNVDTGFKIKKVGSDSSVAWYGNNGTMTSEYCTGWTMSTSVEENCGITTTLAGDYTFSFNTSNNQLSVEYPTANITITFIDNNNWGSCWYYIPNRGDNCNWTSNGFSPTNGGGLKKYGQMTKNGNTYTITLKYPSDMNGKCITFAKSDQHGYGDFHGNEAVHCDDFDISKLICTSTTSQETKNNTKYYTHSWSGACSKPTVTADDPDAICGSGQPEMTASTTNGTIHWYSDSSCSSELTTGTSYTPSSAITTTTNYYLKAIDGTCESEVVTVTATVNPLPTATITGGKKIDCNTASVTLTAGTNAASATYLWSTGATTQSITVSDGGTYYVTVTNTANGCSQKSADYVVTKDTTKPTASISGGTKIDCNTASVTLTAGTNAASATYQWSTGATTASITVSDAGTYYVTVTNTANGCSQKSADYVVTKDTTKPTATISGGTKIDCNTASVTLTAGTDAASATYQWSTGATTASIIVSDAGTYYVTVTNTANGCSQKSAGYVVTKDTTKPTITGTTPASGCVNSDVTISASASTGATVRWYSQQTGGPVVSTGADYVIHNLAADATYWAEAYNSTTGCVSADRTSVEATVKAQTIARTDAKSFNTVVDGSSAATNLTFTQCGYTVTEGSITLVGADAGDFTINSKTISGESITVNVTFHPTTTGSKTVYVQILDNTHQFQITATGACKSGVAASNFNFTNTSVTYNGSEQKPTITPKDATVGAVTTVYYAGTAATGKTDADTYAITIDSEAGTKYCGASKLSLGNFVINKAPQATLTLDKDKAGACVNGGSIQFSTSGGSGDGAVTYAIKSGTGGSITNAGIMTATQAGAFTVQATKAASANYQSATSNNTVTVNFYADPTTGNITASPASPICKGTSTTLTIAGYTAGSTLQWYKGSSILTGKTSASYSTENLSEAATYKVVVSNNGCTSETAPITINVQEPTLTVALTSAAGGDKVYVWEPATFTPTTDGTITDKTITRQSGSGAFIVEDGANDAKIVKAGGENDVFRASFTANLNGCTKTVTKDVTVEKATESCD